jgi:hypothetical protein
MQLEHGITTISSMIKIVNVVGTRRQTPCTKDAPKRLGDLYPVPVYQQQIQ